MNMDAILLPRSDGIRPLNPCGLHSGAGRGVRSEGVGVLVEDDRECAALRSLRASRTGSHHTTRQPAGNVALSSFVGESYPVVKQKFDEYM
jgi:hypothetical protein